MTAEEAKEVLEGYLFLGLNADVCDHVIEMFYPLRDVWTERVKEFCEQHERDKESYLLKQERIRNAIKRIPDEQHRKLLWLRFIERKNWQAIATRLWISGANNVIRKANKSYELFAEQYDNAT